MANTIFNPLTGNFDLVVDDAAEVVYSPSISGDWVSTPDDAAEALDSLAANKAGPVSDVGTGAGGQSLVNLSSTTDVRLKGLKAGTGITITNDAGSNNLEISSVAAGGVAIKDEGTLIVPVVTNIDFVGDGVNTTTDGVGGAIVTISSGSTPVERVSLATVPGDLPVYTYSAGPDPLNPGVGATVVIPSPASPVTIDGYQIQVGELVLLKDLFSKVDNGVYQVLSIGGSGLDAEFIRHTSFDNSSEIPGSKVSVIKGNQNIGKLFVAKAPFAIGIASQFEIGTNEIYYYEPSGTTASNIGGGTGIFKQKTGSDLEFKSLFAGSNITLTSSTLGVTINSIADNTIDVSYAGSPVGTFNSLNFIGSGVSVVDNFPNVDITISEVTPPSVSVSALNINWSLGNVFYKSISTGSTFTFSNVADGKTISLIVINTSGSSVNIVLPAGIKVRSGFSLAVPAGQANVYTFVVANSIIYATYADGLV